MVLEAELPRELPEAPLCGGGVIPVVRAHIGFTPGGHLAHAHLWDIHAK